VPGIGQDLLDVPFGEMVRNLGLAIAEGQTAMDRNSLETLKELVATEVEIITEVTEVVEPVTREVTAGGETIEVTGAQIDATGVGPETRTINMLQAGLLPTFYQFTEALVDVKLSITMREDRAAQSTSQQGASEYSREGAVWWGFGSSRAYASSVDYRTQNTYGYQATGASHLHATLRPVPPPSRLAPAVTTIDTVREPTLVTRTPG
jgi:hypothetical protein